MHPALAGGFLSTAPLRKPWPSIPAVISGLSILFHWSVCRFWCQYYAVLITVCVLVTQLCLTLCNSVDCYPPGSSVHRILQARILENCVAIPFSKGSSRPRDGTRVSHITRKRFTIWATTTVALSSRNQGVIPLALFLILSIPPAILILLWFHTSFRIVLFISVKNTDGILIAIALNL